MDNSYNALQKEINGKIVNDLQRANDALEVVNFMSRFQHLSPINWKWVRSQNPHTKLLLTEKAIENKGFKINDDAKTTLIFVPHNIKGRKKFVKEVRYDISQTNAKMSDFPNRVHDYKTNEQREILSRTLNIAYDHLQSYFVDQAIQAFADRDNLNEALKNIHSQLMSHVVSNYFGMDTTNDVKPVIETWLNMNQNDTEKITVIDSVHWESKSLIADIEKQLEPARATMQSYDQYKKDIEESAMDIKIEQPMFTKNLSVNDVKREPPFSFDKLKKDLGLDIENKAPGSLEDYEYKETQGAYSLINFLDAVGERHPTLMKSQSTKTRGTATDGLTYDTLNRATYECGDLRFEFNGEENVIMLHGNDAPSKFDVFDGDLPEAFTDFKEQILGEIDRLQQLENEKFVKVTPPPKKSRSRVTDEEINKANDVDIVQFIQQNGIDLKSVGRGRYHSKQYSSLVVLATNNKFFHNASGAKGGPIDFAQKMLGIKHFVDAVNYINNGEYNQATYVEVERGEYVYDPSKQSNDFAQAYHYLVDERKIDASIVKGLHERKGIIRQDVHGNVLFPFMEHDEIVGCSVRQTVPDDRFPKQWTQLWSAENRGWNFLNGEPKNLKFFEDPIDALSYMSIHKDKLKSELKDTWFISLHGSATKHGVVHHYMREALNYYVKDVVRNVLESVDVPFSHAQNIFDDRGINSESLQEVLHTAGVSAKTGKDILEVAGKKIESMAMCTDNDKAGWEIANGFGKVFANITPESNFYHTEYKIEIPDSKDWNDERKLQVSLLEAGQQMTDDFVEIKSSNDGYVPEHLLNLEQVSHQAHTQTGMEL